MFDLSPCRLGSLTSLGHCAYTLRHCPQCAGNGLVVMPGFGWSCPQCNGRYVVPEAPASSALAQVALPMASGVPHGEVVPSKRRK